MRYLYILIIVSFAVVFQTSAGIVTFQPGPSAGKDTYVSSGSPNTNYGDLEFMNLGRFGTDIFQTLIEFTELDAYVGTQVNEATLYLFYTVTWQISGCTLYIDRITEDWIEKGDGSVTWNTKPDVEGTPESYGYPTDIEGAWEEYDVTGFVTEWVDGMFENYGLLIYTDDNRYHNADAKTCEYTEPAFRPKLVVDFSSTVESSSLGEIKAAFK